MPARWLIVPFSQIESYLPKRGTIVDIGCGEGVMATFTALESKKRKVIGLDINKNKIRLAKSIGRKISNLKFKKGNVLTDDLPSADGFILSDFLHHLPASDHHILLKRIFESLKKDGVIIIKEIDLQDGARAMVSRFFDFVFYPFQKVDFINSDILKNFLTTIGARTSIIKVKKWFPGSTTLFIIKK